MAEIGLEVTIRIIAGKSKGTKLKTAPGLHTRPTADRVKEAVFSVIQFELPGARMLDLFAGSGQMGLEAASRGASFVMLCDNDREAIAVMRANVGAVKADELLIVQADYKQALQKAKAHAPFNIVYIDPPYGLGLIDESLTLLSSPGLLAEDALVICEEEQGYAFPAKCGTLTLGKTYNYGRIIIGIYQNQQEG